MNAKSSSVIKGRGLKRLSSLFGPECAEGDFIIEPNKPYKRAEVKLVGHEDFNQNYF